ncbi:hypothetical protein E0765_11805 [Sulfuricurvum sp. IAE1]|uniref:ORC-CDC6 family AAA ATPase n=1 Tax=Sulfuricurvum sp. IAE1 TaxID=2546102 RepID=UPI00104CDB03|nr:hypothetical protein [Sulfuricurvum sp. IAE1]TDA62488.1 hypothetical protein E0765_11805 [Sulfuricurvum sp. IAE1]
MFDNPFIHEAATNIDDTLLYKMFIDNEHSRIFKSHKNVFILGYRGSGKSMLMRYHSFPIQIKHNYEEVKNYSEIGIYVSCMTPIFQRLDFGLNDDSFQISIMSEHILVLTMAERLLNTFLQLENSPFSSSDLQGIKEEIEFYFDAQLTEENVLKDFHKWIRKNLVNTQRHLDRSPEQFISSAYTYSSLIKPLIEVFKEVPILKHTHFMFMIDDGQMLSTSQQLSVNNWISYRDTSDVSFKVAITSTNEYSFLTSRNNVILENHDYIMLDLERDFFSGKSDFVQFAKKIIERRLRVFGLTQVDAYDFFPIDSGFQVELESIKEKFIGGHYPEREQWTQEQRQANASKFIRAIYFRLYSEQHKANKPRLAYTGFDVLTNISTGVIRNLLVPCSVMYEKEKENQQAVQYISPKTQYETLLEESSKTWDKINELSVKIVDCTNEHTVRLQRVLESFGEYLKIKLLDPSGTEKKILSFTIHDLDKSPYCDEIKEVLQIGIRGGLIYTRIGPDHEGGRTMWYTPNRILWPSLALDPVGQNGRKNFVAATFYKMMTDASYSHKENGQKKYVQGEFDL